MNRGSVWVLLAAAVAGLAGYMVGTDLKRPPLGPGTAGPQCPTCCLSDSGLQLSIDPAGEPTIVYKSSPCQMVAMFCDSSSTDTTCIAAFSTYRLAFQRDSSSTDTSRVGRTDSLEVLLRAR